MYLARLILGKLPVWNGNLIHYSGGYRISDMRECIELMFQYLIAPIEHDEFFKICHEKIYESKYSLSKLG